LLLLLLDSFGCVDFGSVCTVGLGRDVFIISESSPLIIYLNAGGSIYDRIVSIVSVVLYRVGVVVGFGL